MAWAKNGTPHTLGSSADVITISDLTAYKFGVVMFHHISTGNTNHNFTLDNTGGTTYAQRQSSNGGADGTVTSTDDMHSNQGSAISTVAFHISYLCDISGEESLLIHWRVDATATGAANAPARQESVGKWATTTQHTRIDYGNSDSGSFDTSSNLSALGTD